MNTRQRRQQPIGSTTHTFANRRRATLPLEEVRRRDAAKLRNLRAAILAAQPEVAHLDLEAGGLLELIIATPAPTPRRRAECCSTYRAYGPVGFGFHPCGESRRLT